MPRVIVIIPTYNEAENIPLIVPAVLEQDASIELLVVDDNSPDGTGNSWTNWRMNLIACIVCTGRQSKAWAPPIERDLPKPSNSERTSSSRWTPIFPIHRPRFPRCSRK